ncbi:hypothetical protein OG2516_08608 [Oceanicola granulosus HTCC2516]|uniref:Peptidase M48 domain-containing protein n=2 Tax=Oceanicola granulosus (strain ATCC BAA-861 / DSM 15982 / KCTC 12143 / HTCC2516) TaxID=314256 RepID=Q2CAX4_OCEGH|nr:M48 family metallopeptidase [Oceanicola granulosus]EAR49802.1 hypothetical protein OG2516_08608 [Oceanicola granulosus HTCC2516]
MSRTPGTVIAVGRTPPRFRGHGIYLDGTSAAARATALSFDDATGELVLEDVGARWPYDEIRRLRDQAGGDQAVLRLADDPVRRLVLSAADDIRLVRSRARRLDRAPRVRGRGRLAAWGVAAVASVALIVLVLVPALADRLAAFLPPGGERALGEATYEQIRNALGDDMMPLEVCDAPEGRAALAALEARLTEGAGLEVPLTVHVLDHEMANAFALPGGHIVFFRGLIEEAARPEEVAAVFAHEIGHVAARDPTRIALRSAGSIGVIGLLLGDFAGGALVLVLTNQLIRADYTREAEAAADAFAHRRLLAADLPPDGVATFFERLLDETGAPEPHSFARHLSSHPAMGDRIAAARAATPEGRVFSPALDADQWAALQAICRR